MRVNWTPRRTGKGNAFKCFLACRLGPPVRLTRQPITVQYYLSLFAAILYRKIKGLDGYTPPVNKAVVRSRTLDTESTFELKALYNYWY